MKSSLTDFGHKLNREQHEELLQEDLNKCSLVFVYGTLKNGECNWFNVLAPVEAPFLGETTLKNKGVLAGQGIPYLYEEGIGDNTIPEEEYSLVKGHIFEVPEVYTLARLDRLEGHPWGYCRRIVETTDGRKAWAYFCDHHRIGYRTVTGNGWKEVQEDGTFIWNWRSEWRKS